MPIAAQARLREEDDPMVRVLVVNHDVDMADLQVDALRRAGYEVDQCSGPTHARGACPVLRGLPCWQVEWADVLVYDVWSAGDGGAEMTSSLHTEYPGKGIVLTNLGMGVSWLDESDAAPYTVLNGAPTRATLAAAVETALAAVQAAG
jgi:DNA-binding NtrC family response regulator